MHENGTPIPMPAPPRSMWLRLSVRWGFASISISISSFFFRGGGGGETALRPLHFFGSGPVCLRLSLRSAVIVMWRKAQPSLPTIQQERANEQRWGRDFLHPRGDEISLGKEAPDRLYQKLASISKKRSVVRDAPLPVCRGKRKWCVLQNFSLVQMTGYGIIYFCLFASPSPTARFESMMQKREEEVKSQLRSILPAKELVSLRFNMVD